MTDTIKWENPPAHRRQATKCPVSELQIKEMQAHPGDWALIAEYETKNGASPTATRIRKGTYVELGNANDWEVTARADAEANISKIWMRYTPKAAE